MWLTLAASASPEALRSSSVPSFRVAFSVAARSSGAPVSAATASTRPDDTGIEDARLRDIDAGFHVDLVAREVAIEPGRAMRARRQEIGEAEAVAGLARRAGQLEIAADDTVEDRIGSDEPARTSVDLGVERAVGRVAVDVRADARLPLERGASQLGEAAQVRVVTSSRPRIARRATVPE